MLADAGRFGVGHVLGGRVPPGRQRLSQQPQPQRLRAGRLSSLDRYDHGGPPGRVRVQCGRLIRPADQGERCADRRSHRQARRRTAVPGLRRRPAARELAHHEPLRRSSKASNTLRIEVDPALSDNSWGISRAQIEVTGTGVDGRHYRLTTIASTYFNNWQWYDTTGKLAPYANEGTWTDIMEPQGYDGVETHPLADLGARLWLERLGVDGGLPRRGRLPGAGCSHRRTIHGEVWNDFLVIDPGTGIPMPGTGRRSMGSRASQWDILDIVNYMQAHYNVDPTRIYLVGHSMGGMTALLAGARFADRFAAVVSDSAPTDLAAWEDETRRTSRTGRHAECRPSTTRSAPRRASYLEPTHYPGQAAPGARLPLRISAPLARGVGGQLPAPALVDLAPERRPEGSAASRGGHVRLGALAFSPDHVERTYFPGVHGDRINGADFANTQLDWLAQFRARRTTCPQTSEFQPRLATRAPLLDRRGLLDDQPERGALAAGDARAPTTGASAPSRRTSRT